ncbi:MAG: hypothetical protein IPJ65_43375 [Archangiaceae bacterium]|nr:hypothetical protein [Archangiaceae bacterium]
MSSKQVERSSEELKPGRWCARLTTQSAPAGVRQVERSSDELYAGRSPASRPAQPPVSFKQVERSSEEL